MAMMNSTGLPPGKTKTFFSFGSGGGSDGEGGPGGGGFGGAASMWGVLLSNRKVSVIPVRSRVIFVFIIALHLERRFGAAKSLELFFERNSAVNVVFNSRLCWH